MASVVLGSDAEVKRSGRLVRRCPRQKATGRAALLLGLVILLWGVNWPIMKVGLRVHAAAVVRARRGSRWARSVSSRCCWRPALCGGRRAPICRLCSRWGCCRSAAFLGLTHSALMFVEAGRSAILAYTTPLWVAPLSALFLREHLTPAKLLAVGLGMTGVAVLFNPLAVDYRNHRVLLGNGLLLLAAHRLGRGDRARARSSLAGESAGADALADAAGGAGPRPAGGLAVSRSRRSTGRRSF